MMKISPPIIVVAASIHFLVAGCTIVVAQSIETLNTTEFSDIRYFKGDDSDSNYHKLNLVIPSEPDAPLLIWIGGGAWSYGDRNVEMDFARRLGNAGIAVASVGHRMSAATWKDPKLKTGIQHPEHIKDVSRAAKFLFDHAQEYGYSQDRLFIGGYSSGAHLAALLVMDSRFMEREGLTKNLFHGVIPVAGTFDVAHYYKVLSESNPVLADNHIGSVFGTDPKAFADASPTTYIRQLTIPMLLISETNTYRYTRYFEDKLHAADVDALEVLHVLRLNHGGLWRNLSHADHSPYRDLIIDFIRRNAPDTDRP